MLLFIKVKNVFCAQITQIEKSFKKTVDKTESLWYNVQALKRERQKKEQRWEPKASLDPWKLNNEEIVQRTLRKEVQSTGSVYVKKIYRHQISTIPKRTVISKKKLR